MKKEFKEFNLGEFARQIGDVLLHQCTSGSEETLIKEKVQESYGWLGHVITNNIFMNQGFWDKKIYNEYQELNVNFSAISAVPNIYAQLLLYYLIRPLIKMEFFDKRVLDIGCGNGTGLRLSSELLKADYALGVDLVHELVSNSKETFYKENKLDYIQSDSEHLALESESFDIVTSLESSHLYPRIENFFAEVGRVLAPGGYFCYTDHLIPSKDQSERLEAYLKTQKSLKIIEKHDITKMVQASVYQRVIVNEKAFFHDLLANYSYDQTRLYTELTALSSVSGLEFLPWWRIWFKNPALRIIAKNARKNKFWGKKYYFYYLIQKVDK